MRLANQKAIVTGAAAGIGKAIALAFGGEGADVAIVDLQLGKAEHVAEQIRGMGRQTLAIEADVSDTAQVQAALREVLDAFGGVDILVNNAAVILQSKAVDTTDEQWDRIIRNNLRSVFVCSREVCRQMIEQGRGGKVINISSIHAVLSEPSAAAYTAAKGGVEAFSRTLATELAPHRIRVNYIRPGATFTELTIPMYTDPVKKALFERVPMKEIAQPEWIAAAALFLASDESRYMTGSGLDVDGGYIMDGSLPGASYWEDQ